MLSLGEVLVTGGQIYQSVSRVGPLQWVCEEREMLGMRAVLKMCDCVNVSVVYCCVTNHPKT